MQDRPLVSIIVPTRNSALFLAKCLESIRSQTYPKIEIIVVDNYSTDETREIAKRFGVQFFLKGPERSSQRNFGAQNARGRFLFFIDSDMELMPKVVEECVVKAQGKGAQAVIVPEISVGEGFWARCKALEKQCYINDETIEAARFFLKETFWGVNGYDEKMIAAEDWDLHLKIKRGGAEINRIDALIKHNEGQVQLSSLIKKKYYYGNNLRLYLEKHRGIAGRQFILFRPAFARNWRKLVRDPIHAFGMMYMKACEFGASGFGCLVSVVIRREHAT